MGAGQTALSNLIGEITNITMVVAKNFRLIHLHIGVEPVAVVIEARARANKVCLNHLTLQLISLYRS